MTAGKVRDAPGLADVAAARGTLRAAPPNEQEIAKLYARGLAGDAGAVAQCMAALEQVLAADPDNQLARVYLGSAETLRSRDLPFGLAKWKMLQRGISRMDEAAAAAPDEPKVLLLRAITNEAFPAILGRRAIARQAFEDLVARVEKDPAKLSSADRALLYLDAGKAEAFAGAKTRARVLWERGAALADDPRMQQELQIALATLK